MEDYFILNLSELAARRAILMREEAQLWDIFARDLKREAKRRTDTAPKTRTSPQTPPIASDIPANNTNLYVRIPQAARLMGIGRSSLYKEIGDGRIPIRKCGRKTLIAVADIHAWFEDLPKA